MYGFLLTIINDQKDQIISILWKCLYKKYSISIKFFSAYHPEINNQIESINKVIKNYFCVYINHTQNDWVNSLSIVKFAANNHVNSAIKLTLFFANHEFYLHINIKPLEKYDSE